MKAVQAYPLSARRLSNLVYRFIGGRPESIAGIAAIEFAVATPILILMAVSAVDLGTGFYRRMQVEDAAQAGARYATIHHKFQENSIANAVLSATSLSGISASPAPSQFCGCYSSTGIVSVSCTSTCTGGGTPGTYAAVSAQASYTTLLPYPGLPKTFVFQAKSTVRLQ